MTVRHTLGLYIAAVLILTAASLALLKSVDWLLIRSGITEFYLFPPQYKARYKTSEFDAIASTNQFGFRGSEQDLSTGQILAIGDSFTFGFGNSDSQTWPAQLQDRLRQSATCSKVYNLGTPATDTLYHIEVARQFVQRLKPKVVVISVLLADDLQQVHEARVNGQASTWSERARSVAKAAFPGIYRGYRTLATRNLAKADQSIPVVTADWPSDSGKYLDSGQAAYSADIVQRIQQGDINPGLLYQARHYPRRGWEFWERVNLNGSTEQQSYEIVRKQFAALNEEIRAVGGELVLLSMPSGDYVDSKSSENHRRIGFDIRDRDFRSDLPEQSLVKLAGSIGANFIPALAEFRRATDDPFFAYDGHLTGRGNAIVAQLAHTYLAGRPDSLLPCSR